MRTMPIPHPISVWFGGGVTDRMLRRMARLGDGWIEPMLDYPPRCAGQDRDQ